MKFRVSETSSSRPWHRRPGRRQPGGALPVLSGVRLEVDGRPAAAGRHRPRSHDPGRDRRSAATSDGVCVVPARLVADIVRALEPGAVTVRGRRRRGPHLRRAGRSSRSGCCRPRSSRGCPQPPGDAVTLAAADFAEALRQVVRGRQRATTPDPILTGVLMAAEDGGLRLVATDSYRLAVRDLPGTSVLREGQRCSCRRGPWPSCSGCSARRRAGHPAPRRARRPASRSGDVRLTHPAHRGRVPELPPADPGSYPNRAHRRQGAAARRRAPGEAAGPRRDHAGAHRAAARRARAHGVTQDVGQATEDLDAKYEGTEMIVAFNPEYPDRRRRGDHGRRGRPRDARRPEAGHRAVHRGATTCTC